MSVSLGQFEQNILRAKNLVALHSSLQKQLTAAVDISDMLRACYVMAVSAVDHYIHDITYKGMMDIFEGRRPETSAYLKFRLSMKCLTGVSTVSATRDNVEADIREQHSYLAFQRPDRIADAIRLFSNVRIWDEVGSVLKASPSDIKNRMELIVNRRNKIAHEADLDPTYPNTRWPISEGDVESTINFVTDMVVAIDGLIK